MSQYFWGLLKISKDSKKSSVVLIKIFLSHNNFATNFLRFTSLLCVYFLAVQSSAINDLVTRWLTHLQRYLYFWHIKSNPLETCALCLQIDEKTLPDRHLDLFFAIFDNFDNLSLLTMLTTFDHLTIFLLQFWQ